MTYRNVLITACLALAGWIAYDRVLHWWGQTEASVFAVVVLLAAAAAGLVWADE